MIDYNGELFNEAQNDCNNAITSLSLLGSLISNFQSCDPPNIIDASKINSIVSSCNTLKNNSSVIKTSFYYMESSIKEMIDAEDEYSEYNDNFQEYNDLLADIDSLEKQKNKFDFSTLGGWIIDSETSDNLEDELSKKRERKNELEKILGINTKEEKKWYEELWDVVIEQTDDWANVVDLGKKARADTGANNESKEAYNQAYIEHFTKMTSTGNQIGTDILRGIGNAAEGIVDFLTQMFGGYTAMETARYAGFKNADQTYDENSKIIKDQTQAIVTKEVINDLYTSYYETKNGKLLNDNSYIKYDDILANTINNATKGIVDTAATIAITTIGGPTGALYAGATGGGNAVQTAYANDATFDEATVYSGIEAVMDAGMWYVLGNSAKGIQGLNSSAAMFGKDASLKILGNYALNNAGVVGVKPFVDAVAEKITYNSETNLANIISDNNSIGKSLLGIGLASLSTYVPSAIAINKATAAISMGTLGLPAATGATETATYTTAYSKNIGSTAIGFLNSGASDVLSLGGLSLISNDLVLATGKYIPTTFPLALANAINPTNGELLDVHSLYEIIDKLTIDDPTETIDVQETAGLVGDEYNKLKKGNILDSFEISSDIPNVSDDLLNAQDTEMIPEVFYEETSNTYNEFASEKELLDYFCGPDCSEYYTDTSSNYSLNWSSNFFANDLAKGFFDDDNSYEFAYQKVASKMTDPEIVKKFYKFLDETKSGTYFKMLKCSEWEALLNYSGAISKSINIPLLMGTTKTNFIEKTILELDSAISKFKLETDIVTYSAQSIKKFASFGIENIDELSQLKGNLMLDKSFVSSSPIPYAAYEPSIIMKIETPAGSNCAYLGIISSNPSENEVLYGRNTVFKINDVIYKENSSGEKTAYMYMQVMN